MMKHIKRFICCLIFVAQTLHSQTPKIDSLKKELLRFNRTDRVDTNLYKVQLLLGYHYRNIDVDTSILHHEKALLTAQKLKDNIRQSYALNELGWDYKSLAVYDSAFIFSEQALKISNEFKTEDPVLKRRWKRTRANIFEYLGAFCYETAQYQKAIEFQNSALEINEELNNRRGQASNFNNLGNAYKDLGFYKKAIDCFDKALKLCISAGDKQLEARILGNTGVIYSDQANYPKALEYYYKALRINEDLKSRADQSNDLTNIGVVYMLEHNFEKAREYFLRSLDIDQETGNKNGVSYSYANLGTVYQEEKEFEKALEFYNKAYDLAAEIGNPAMQADCLSNIAFVYSDMGQYEKAYEVYEKCLLSSRSTGDKMTEGSTLANLGALSLQAKKPALAEKYFSEALPIIKDLGNLTLEKNLYDNMHSMYEQRGDFRSALKYYKLSVLIRDSIANEENVKKQTQTEMQFEFDKKQAADSIQTAERIKRESLKHEEEIKQQRIYTYGGIIGFVLMLIVAIVSFRAYRQKQHANQMISEQKHLVEEKQKEILDSIHYARRIQNSLLPKEKYIDKSLGRLRSDQEL